jgi:hypothetical protein
MKTIEPPARQELPRKKIGQLQIAQVAVYYRDGMEMGWVKLDEKQHFPVEIQSPKWIPVGPAEDFDAEEEVSVIQDIPSSELTTFAVETHKDASIDVIRAEAKEKFGREIHIRAKIGPTEISEDGSSLTCPIEAVDDGCLSGAFNQWPQNKDHVLLVGHFK